MRRLSLYLFPGVAKRFFINLSLPNVWAYINFLSIFMRLCVNAFRLCLPTFLFVCAYVMTIKRF